MYKTGQVLAVSAGAATFATTAVMPSTGMDNAVQIAVAAAAGLAVWAGIYIAGSLFSKH
jgi:hypothetical protein